MDFRLIVCIALLDPVISVNSIRIQDKDATENQIFKEFHDISHIRDQHPIQRDPQIWNEDQIRMKHQYPFQNPALPWGTRVDDLVGRLTLQEMTEQMARGGRLTHAPGIPRLGVPPYPWGSECLRGDVEAGPATSFPQAIGLAASFSRQLLYNVTLATGREVRAKYNNYSSHGDYGLHTSASCWRPVINILRDPRWGRNQETYGEDPYLSGELAAAYVTGLQGNHPRYVRANAGCKHFAAYGGPENIPQSRHSFDAKVSEVDLRNTFLPAFKRCVQAGSYSIMCSYNRVNGVPACANKYLLTDILRHEWGFNGYVISDEGAIEDIYLHHNYTSSKQAAATAAVLAGTNLEDGPARLEPYFSYLSSAVTEHKLDVSALRAAVKPLFYTRMRLGLFDPPEMNPYSKLDVRSVVQNEAHRELAIAAAAQTFVLLKNDGTLPLKRRTVDANFFDKIAILGPMANNTAGIFGGYAPDPDPIYVYTPLRGLKGLGRDVTYAAGCQDTTRCQVYHEDDVRDAVKDAELIVVCLGTGEIIENESNDRKDIQLPGKQLQLLQDAVKYASGSARVVVLLFSGGPLDIRWAVSAPRVSAVLACFFPAQGTGLALLRLLTATGVTPAARLPMSWPAGLDQFPAMTDYSMNNRTYRYLTHPPLFPFGYGLSYSRFRYDSLSLRPSVLHFTELLTLEVAVTNIGLYDADEVVQVYASWPRSNQLPGTPRIQLVEFGRYHIPAGQAVTCVFRVPLERFSLWGGSSYVVPQGEYTVYAGGQQPNQQMKVPSNVLQGNFTVRP